MSIACAAEARASQEKCLVDMALIEYAEFARRCRSEWRFVPDRPSAELLDEIARTAAHRTNYFSEANELYRAQLGCACDDEGSRAAERDSHEGFLPFASVRMKPRLAAASEGRANPKGIPVLYLSTDCRTAITEVRPFSGAHVTVASFTLSRESKLVDCLGPKSTASAMLSKTCTDLGHATKLWEGIVAGFGAPVLPTDSTADYAPTQIIAKD